MPFDADHSPSTKQLTGTEGCPVFTADDKPLGHVKEVAGAYFKVDADMQPDYWLTQDDVKSASPNQVILNCTQAELGKHKRKRPGPGPRANPDAPPQGDIIA